MVKKKGLKCYTRVDNNGGKYVSCEGKKKGTDHLKTKPEYAKKKHTDEKKKEHAKKIEPKKRKPMMAKKVRAKREVKKPVRYGQK